MNRQQSFLERVCMLVREGRALDGSTWIDGWKSKECSSIEIGPPGSIFESFRKDHPLTILLSTG